MQNITVFQVGLVGATALGTIAGQLLGYGDTGYWYFVIGYALHALFGVSLPGLKVLQLVTTGLASWLCWPADGRAVAVLGVLLTGAVLSGIWAGWSVKPEEPRERYGDRW